MFKNIEFQNGDMKLYGLAYHTPDLTGYDPLLTFYSEFKEETVYYNDDTHICYFTYGDYWFAKTGKVKPEFAGASIRPSERLERYFRYYSDEYLPILDVMKVKHFPKITTLTRDELVDIYGFQAYKQTNKALRNIERCIFRYTRKLEQEEYDPNWGVWSNKTEQAYVVVKQVKCLKVNSEQSFYMPSDLLEFVNERQLKIGGVLGL